MTYTNVMQKKKSHFFLVLPKKVLSYRVLRTQYKYLKQLSKTKKRNRSARLEQFKKKRKMYFSVENGKVMLWQTCTMYEVCSIKKVLHCHFPDLQTRLSSLSDPRKGVTYSIEELVMAAVVLFLLNCDSRNAFNNKTKNEQFRQNYYHMFRMELPQTCTVYEVRGMDAVNDLFEKISPEELEKIRCCLISKLIDRRVFHRFRFFGGYFYIAVDATGVYNWGDAPPDGIRKHALKKEYEKGKVNYSNQIFEAVLVCAGGMTIPLMSEWVANVDGNPVKQDCELNAFKRLSVRLKKYFPRLPVCILADGLYLYCVRSTQYSNVSTMEICQQYGWKFTCALHEVRSITVFKDGTLSSVWEEVNSLLPLKDGCCHKETLFYESKHWITRKYRWINNIEYQKHRINWIECVQESVHQDTGEKDVRRFVFLTNHDVNHGNVVQLLAAGRARWLIEDFFNTQKNRGGALHHKFTCTVYPKGINTKYAVIAIISTR